MQTRLARQRLRLLTFFKRFSHPFTENLQIGKFPELKTINRKLVGQVNFAGNLQDSVYITLRKGHARSGSDPDHVVSFVPAQMTNPYNLAGVFPRLQLGKTYTLIVKSYKNRLPLLVKTFTVTREWSWWRKAFMLLLNDLENYLFSLCWQKHFQERKLRKLTKHFEYAFFCLTKVQWKVDAAGRNYLLQF